MGQLAGDARPAVRRRRLGPVGGHPVPPDLGQALEGDREGVEGRCHRAVGHGGTVGHEPTERRSADP